MAIEKQECSRSNDELSLVFQTFSSLGSPSSRDAIITMDEEEDETLASKNKKTNNLDSNSLPPSTCAVIILDDDEEVTLESNKNKKRKNLDSNPSTGAIIIIDEEKTLEPKKKKQRLGSWWDDVDAFDQLSCMIKGSPTVHSCFSSTNLPETKTKEEDKRSLSSSHHENLLGYSDSVTSNNKEYQDCLGYGHVSLPRLGGYVKDIATPTDSCFPSSSSTGLLQTMTNTNKDYESQLSSSNHHGDNFIDFREGEFVGESTNNSSNKGIRHVSLEELGVSVEDLKSLPWEAFDPTWEIRSVTMDPWLGGYVSDMFSAH
ncbi:hypothetical protein Bca4012_084063 [Brassica carinata]|uniref:Uncharacterized protein n=1 Tax=Brassica carinata TaxID=52824 RepID=A0A8X7SL90_BRACI|nr:hypothetical protein Bca52824_026732 [Brassica carinata]